jgi:pimeloyl-ACP methyl ester carboxylesterase
LASMAAEQRFEGVERLILYEPPLMVEPLGPRGEEVVAKMQEALDAGDRKQVVTIFLCDQIGVPAERLAQMEASPIWPVVLEISCTLPRESREVNTPRSWQDRLARWKTPVTMLLGTETSPRLKASTEFVSRAIPACRVVELQGQGHSAMMEAPDLFLAKV